MTGKLYGLGLGPGDPELITLKAHRILTAAPVVAYPAPDTGPSFARQIAAAYLRFHQVEVPIVVPMRVERFPAREIYDEAAETLSRHLDAGLDVAVLCEGDPFFYGSSMYLFDRLRGEFRQEVVPGITAMGGCWARTQTPVVHGDDILTVLPGTLDGARMAERLRGTDAAVIMKVGRNLPKIRAALEEAGLTARALYVERGTMAAERIIPLAERDDAPAPYFSLVLVPGRQRVR